MAVYNVLIGYTVAASAQKAVIISALADIMAKTCIKFNITTVFPAKDAYIFYAKESYATL